MIWYESAIWGLRIAWSEARITHLPFAYTIDRIEPLLQYCSCSSKTMMNSVTNKVHHTINKLDKTARLVDIIVIRSLMVYCMLFKTTIVTLWTSVEYFIAIPATPVILQCRLLTVLFFYNFLMAFVRLLLNSSLSLSLSSLDQGSPLGGGSSCPHFPPPWLRHCFNAK